MANHTYALRRNAVLFAKEFAASSLTNVCECSTALLLNGRRQSRVEVNLLSFFGCLIRIVRFFGGLVWIGHLVPPHCEHRQRVQLRVAQ